MANELSPVPSGVRAYLNPDTKLLELYDKETGKLLAVQQSVDEALRADREAVLVDKVLPDGSIVRCSSAIDPLALTGFRLEEYSSIVVDLICQKITEGHSLTKICQMRGFPTYAQLCRWKKLHPSINDQLAEARRDRAEYLRDVAYAEAMAVTEDDASAGRVRIDTLKWLAGTDDKERFGSGKGVVAEGNVQIIVNTGIQRDIKD